MHVFRLLGICLLAGVPAARTSHGAPPCVRFDVAEVVACQDVTPGGYSATNIGEKLIKARFPISSLIRLGREDSLIQYLYIIASSSRPFQIVDYSPHTELKTDVTGHLSVETRRGKRTNLGIKAALPRESPVQSDAAANFSSTATDSVRFEKLPPRQILSASGTMQRGAALYFKLKPSTQTSLEGDKTFEIIARVPSDWRGGLMHVHCAAYGQARGISTLRDEADLVCGRRAFIVGIYLEGDAEAKAAVWAFAQTQRHLRQLAVSQAGKIDKERFPSLGHKLGGAFSLVEPRIPERWLDRVLATPQLPEFSRHLPREVRVAATRYDEARRAVTRLAGS